MIRRMVLSNFYSFQDRSVIDLAVLDSVPPATSKLVAPSESSKRYPRVIGLYGPNASGKSTILRAIAFISTFVAHSFSIPPTASIPCQRFASERMKRRPIELEIEFDAPFDLEGKIRASAPTCPYTYCIEFDGGEGQPSQVSSEVLYQHPPESRRIKLFERDRNGLASGSRTFGLQGFTKSLERVLRPNASVISTLAQLGHNRSQNIQHVATSVYTNVYTQFQSDGQLAERYLGDGELLSQFNGYVARLDLGVTKVSVSKAPSERAYPDVHYHHKGLDRALHISSESQGTRHFFRIFPVIFDALAEGGAAVIDEMDSSIHSLLLPEIISWFWNRKRNPRNAQLWFTCQNPYLLQELSKEEILFIEKRENGGSEAFMLGEVRSVRRDDNYMKKYLGGAYGALPHFG